MDITGYEELLREIAFQADMETLGALLKTGKTIWGVLRDDDMKILRDQHLVRVDTEYGYHHRRRDNGQIHGREVLVDEPVTIINYRNDQLHGAYLVYNEGVLTVEKRFKNGRMHGVYKRYHDNGVLARSATYKNGKSHGLHYLYDANGSLLIEAYFKGNSPVWIIGRDSDGNISYTKQYRKGQLHGWQNYYHKNKRIFYRNGKFRHSQKL